MQPSYLVNLANIIHLTEGILVPLTSCYRCRCCHCGRRVWWIHYGYWAKREWLHRLRLAKHLYTGTVSQCVLNFPFPMFGWWSWWTAVSLLQSCNVLQHTIDKWLSPHGGLLLNKGITNEVTAPPHSPEINGEVHPAKHSSESPDSRSMSPALPRNLRALAMEILMNGHGNSGAPYQPCTECM